MKKTVLLLAMSGLCILARAQRFFYVEPKDPAGLLLSRDLLQAAQFVSDSALTSDYIITTKVDFSPMPGTASMKIIVEDSVSFKPVFQASEEYHFSSAQISKRILFDLAVQTFIKRNMPDIVVCTAREHQQKLMGADF